MSTETETTIKDEVDKIEKDRYKSAKAYKFSNDREFEDSDSSDSGVYDGT